ncbi:hypothetical protein [Bartonella machadoae]|nr:hypothetical protein [Bartonella machadoae]UNE54009.1 hypothetical protein LNM86_10670 [Bartonella machadoae]
MQGKDLLNDIFIGKKIALEKNVKQTRSTRKSATAFLTIFDWINSAVPLM